MREGETSITWFTFEEVAIRCGVEVDIIEQLVSHGLLDVRRGSPPRVACHQTLRVSRAVRLQRDLGVNVQGIAVILDLLDRIEALETELSLLGRR